MIQFYDSQIETTHRLCAEESAHAVRVLRKHEGDTVYVTDGKGARFECRLLSADPKGCEVEIIGKEVIPQVWNGFITLAVAPTKNADRMEWMVEKCVELGVNRIVFVKCARSERKNMRTDRLIKIAVSAMKQSLKTTLPEIIELTPFNNFIKSCKDEETERLTIDSTQQPGMKFMGYCDEGIKRLRLVDEYVADRDVTLLIGPEGDFTPDEVTLAMDSGFIPVTFGDTRLRTETAAICALQTIHVIDLLH